MVLLDAFGTWNTSDGFDLYNNEWNSSGHPGPQRICGNSGRDWQVTSLDTAGREHRGADLPSVQRNYPDLGALELLHVDDQLLRREHERAWQAPTRKPPTTSG